jgi:hypothetical protein
MNETLQLRDELREALLEAQESTRWLRAELHALTRAEPKPAPHLPVGSMLAAAVSVAVSVVGLAWWMS